jgi:hypothetical protein
MDPAQLEAVDRALLVIGEARERAEQAAKTVRTGDNRSLLDALENADRSLLAIHGALMRAAYFPAAPADEQLKLAR